MAQDRAQQLMRELGLHPALAQLLVGRGIEKVDEAQSFLYPDLTSGLRPPELLPDIKEASALMREALSRGLPILLWGHDDLDGALGVRILLDTLSSLGAEVESYLPDRYATRHGLNPAGLKAAAQRGIKLVITVDCGATNHSEVELARELGISTIITDHHQPIQGLARADAVVMPTRLDRLYPFPGLSGAGVAHKLSLGLIESLLKSSEAEAIKREPDHLALVALSIIADRMPILDENRVFIKFGLEALCTPFRSGLKLLRAILPDDGVNPAGVADLLIPLLSGNPGSELVKFFAPDLNPNDARAIFESFKERSQQFYALARAEFARIQSELIVHPDLVIAADPKLPVRCLGYCTTRLRAQFKRSAIALAQLDKEKYPQTETLWYGELRASPDFNGLKLLGSLAEYLVDYGGHPNACGFKVEGRKIDELLAALQAQLAKPAHFRISSSRTDPDRIEVSWPLSELGPDLLFLAPFGKGNPPPKLGSPDTILYRESEGLRTPDNPELHFTPNPITDQIQDGVYDLVYTVGEDLRIHILTAHQKDSKLAD